MIPYFSRLIGYESHEVNDDFGYKLSFFIEINLTEVNTCVE